MSTVAPGAEKRTQEERSTATRSRLLEATVECLIEFGYAGTTTTLIADRAGVSRGAQLHHYPTKADLVAATIHHLSIQLGETVVAQAAKLPKGGGAGRAEAALDLLWAAFDTPLFEAWLELWMASRTDPDLAETLKPVEQRLREGVRLQSRSIFDAEGSDTTIAGLIDVTLMFLQGMALNRAISNDPSAWHRREVALLGSWKKLMRAELSTL